LVHADKTQNDQTLVDMLVYTDIITNWKREAFEKLTSISAARPAMKARR